MMILNDKFKRVVKLSKKFNTRKKHIRVDLEYEAVQLIVPFHPKAFLFFRREKIPHVYADKMGNKLVITHT